MEKLRVVFGINLLDKQDKLDELVMDDCDDEKQRKIRKGDLDDDSEREEGEILYGDGDLKIEKFY